MSSSAQPTQYMSILYNVSCFVPCCTTRVSLLTQNSLPWGTGKNIGRRQARYHLFLVALHLELSSSAQRRCDILELLQLRITARKSAKSLDPSATSLSR